MVDNIREIPNRRSQNRLSRDRFRDACTALVLVTLISGSAVAIAGASSSHSRDRSAPQEVLVPTDQHVTVTGFVSVSPTNPSSGPISVGIKQPEAAHLVSILNRLPVIQPVGCIEDSLLYKIVFRPSNDSRSDFVVKGFTCYAVVQIRGPGKFVTRRDSTCSFVNAIRHDLPTKARGTKVASVGCNA